MSEILESYDSNQSIYNSYSMSLKSLLNTLIREAGHSIHSLDSRVKTKTSLKEKIDRKGKYTCIEDITDIVGIRIITHYSDDVNKIAKLIEDDFEVDKKNSIDKRVTMEPDRFGYLSLHYVISLTNNRTRLREYSPYKNIKAEIQIRSILQHAWAEIEHDIGYKSASGLPNDVKRYFSRLAGLLEIADDEFIKIKQSISARQQEVVNVLEHGAGEDTLDLVSLYEYINKSKTVTELAHDYALTHGLKFKEQASKNIQDILNGLFFLNIKTIKQLDEKIKEYKESILKRVNGFDDTYIPNFRRTELPREVLIAFLVHVLVAIENSPQLEENFQAATNLSLWEGQLSSFFESIRKAIAAG